MHAHAEHRHCLGELGCNALLFFVLIHAARISDFGYLRHAFERALVIRAVDRLAPAPA